MRNDSLTHRIDGLDVVFFFCLLVLSVYDLGDVCNYDTWCSAMDIDSKDPCLTWIPLHDVLQ